MKPWVGFIAVVCLAAFAALPSGGAANPAASAKMELGTAPFHAGELAQKGTISATQLHLHHTINCLEGPSGPDYSASAGDPCKGQGSGAIPDLKAAVGKVNGADVALTDANAALKMALEGEQTNDVTLAKSLAAQASQHLNKAANEITM